MIECDVISWDSVTYKSKLLCGSINLRTNGLPPPKCQNTGFALQPAAYSLGQIELPFKVYCKEEMFLLMTHEKKFP